MNIAFIPVRGGSKSIPLKNIKIINGRPLIYWVLDAAVNCTQIDKVIVCTDSEQIQSVVAEYPSSKIEIVGRSEGVSTDTASTEAVMLEFAEQHDFENIVLIQATSPLLTTQDLDNAFSKYKDSDIDSVLSVVRQKRFIWDEKSGKSAYPVNYDFYNRPRRQDFDGLLVENGAFYITSRERLLDTKCRISGIIGCVEMEEASYFEIDEPADWAIIEHLLQIQKGKQKPQYKLSHIKILLTDSDGVLTDGGMYYSENGDELKKFNTKDGMAFELLREKGILTGIITGENRTLVKNRATKLKVDEIHMGIKNKLEVLKTICEKYSISLNEVAYIGDDINDLEVIQNVGFGCCVADAMEIVKEHAKYITKTNGGHGAVRELAELILCSL